MTTETTNTFSGPYTGTGTADQEFSVTFQSTGDDEIAVWLDGELVDTSDWSFERDADGRGTVTATLTGEVYILSAPSLAQEADFQRFGPFFPDMVNPPLDRAARTMQVLSRRLDRIAPHDPPGAGASKFLARDAAGLPYYANGTGTDEGLREDLADTSGFTLIMHKRAESGSFARTAAQREAAGMNGPGLSVLEFSSPAFDEALRAETLTNADVSFSDAFNLAFAASLSAGNGMVDAPAGHYPVDISDSGEACLIMPIGTSLQMDPRGLLLPAGATTDGGITTIIVRGNNLLDGVNIDGRALVDANTPDGAWLYADARNPNGIRAYFDADYGLGAEDVTIQNGSLRNLRYGIQSEGAKRWRIQNMRIARTFWSAILMSANTGQHCLHNMVVLNHFEDIGDYACAFNEIGGNTNGQSAFNSISFNTGERANLRTNGHFVGWELAQVLLQHHNKIVGNDYERGRADITFCRGLGVMNSCSHSLMADNVAKGAGSTSNADEAFSARGSKFLQIRGNLASDYRGSAFVLDGCENVTLDGNQVVDCGGSGNAFPIRLALESGGRAITASNNRVSITAAYAAWASQVPSIGAVQAATKVLRDISIIDNVLDRFFDVGISVQGDATLTAINVEIARNKCYARESEDPATTYSEAWPIQAINCVKLTVKDNRSYDAKKGFDIRSSVGVLLAGNEFFGTGTLLYGARLNGSSIIRSRDNRIHQTVTYRLVNNDENAAIKPTDLTDAKFGWDDEFFLNVNAADDTAATAAGVVIGMEYHNAGARRVHVT